MLETMGDLFRSRIRSEADILCLVENGVTCMIYTEVAEHLRLPRDAIGPEAIIRRQLKAHARLDSNKTQRLIRIGRAYALGRDLLGSDERTIAWLHKPARYLRDKAPITPIELATRDAGVRLLEEKLLRMQHGIF